MAVNVSAVPRQGGIGLIYVQSAKTLPKGYLEFFTGTRYYGKVDAGDGKASTLWVVQGYSAFNFGVNQNIEISHAPIFYQDTQQSSDKNALTKNAINMPDDLYLSFKFGSFRRFESRVLYGFQLTSRFPTGTWSNCTRERREGGRAARGRAGRADRAGRSVRSVLVERSIGGVHPLHIARVRTQHFNGRPHREHPRGQRPVSIGPPDPIHQEHRRHLRSQPTHAPNRQPREGHRSHGLNSVGPRTIQPVLSEFDCQFLLDISAIPNRMLGLDREPHGR